MLRKFRDQLSQVADEFPGVLNRQNGNTQGNDRSGLADLADENGEIEGFLCPMCMTHFQSPEALSQHFETMHAEKNAFINPNYDVFSTEPMSRSEKETNLEELRIQLKEEKAYAEKIKEELDRIQAVVAQATDVPSGEVPYLLQQIQMLEAGKSMVTQRMLEFEKEAGQFKRAVDNGAKERAEIMAKLKQQGQQLRELTDDMENNKVEKEMLNREFIKTKADMELLNKEIDKLNKTLDQRPSEDDVAVLRTELVNAQKLMDEIAQQKDIEIHEHIETIRKLNLEREKDNCIKYNLEQQLESSGVNVTENIGILDRLKIELEDTKSILESSRMEAAAKRKQVEQLEIKNRDMQTMLESNIRELSSHKEKIAQLESNIKKSSNVIEDVSDLNTKKQEKILQLSQELEQLMEEKKKQEMEKLAAEDNQHKQDESRKLLEANNNDLMKEVLTFTALLEQERVACTQKVAENEELQTQLKASEVKTYEITSKCERLSKDLEESTLVIHTLRENIASLEANALELMNKISQGEGGAKMAMDQLTTENKKLAEKITEIAAQLQEQKQSRENDIESHNSKLREIEKTSTEQIAEVKKENKELKKKLKESDEEIKRNSDRFVEMEKETESERMRTSERFEKLKEMVQQRDATAIVLRNQIEQQSIDISEKEKLIREKERHLEDSRQKIEESVKRLEEAETKARQLESDLKNSETLRETASATEEELREELSKSQQAIQTLKKEGKQLTASVTEKEHDIEAIKREWDRKAQHWEVKKKEYEEQLLKNQEANEELMGSLNTLQDSFESVKKELETKQKDLFDTKMISDDMTIKITELELTVEEHKKKESDVAKKFEEAVTDKEIIEKMKQELEEEIVTLTTKVEQKKKVIEQLKEDKQQLEEQRIILQTETVSVQHNVEKFEKEFHDQKEKITSLLEEINRLRQTIGTNEAEISNLNEKIRKLEEDSATERYNQTKIMEELTKNNTELTEEKQRLSSDLEKLDVKLIEAINSKEMLEEDFKTNRSSLTEKVNKLEEDLETAKTLSITIRNELQGELSTVKRSVKSLQSEVEEKRRELTEAQSTLQELTSKNMELQQEMTSWNDEKNALIERCLRTESDLDFERERAMENKRRFDDSVAAMHELGRANQSLQMDISKHTSRKWLDDSAAVNCTACGKVFTMTVRKHHCRVCGLIFCGQCSDKTAKVVSNKNAVRVCSTCYVEVQNR